MDRQEDIAELVKEAGLLMYGKHYPPQLAAALGVGVTFIRGVIRGEWGISDEKLRRLSSIMVTRVGELAELSLTMRNLTPPPPRE